MPKVMKKIDLLLTLKHWVITYNIDLLSGVLFSYNFKFGDFTSIFLQGINGWEVYNWFETHVQCCIFC